MSTYLSIDKGWKFREMASPFGANAGGHPMGAEAVDYDDSGWREVNLPHDWAIESPMSPDPYVHGANRNAGQNAFLHGGIGWYRRHVFIHPEDQEVLLQIDGSYRKSEVWVNGVYVGGEDNGYFSYALDITGALVAGDNLIVVRCDNLDTPNCRWYTGSGLYRHVWLIRRERTHFAHWGVAVTTPRVARDSALVHVSAALEGPRGMVEVKAEILDPDGNPAAHGAVRAALGRGKGAAELDLPVARPMLWGLDAPQLYTLRLTLLRDGRAVDTEEIPFGIRSIEFRKGAGFLLNGEPTKLKGICMHHDGGYLGAAVPETVWASRLKTLKEIGCNAIRTSHNPPAPEVLDLCDRMGFVVMDELCDKWEPPHYVNFAKNWRKDLSAWIRRDRNHPSVIMWSVGNENDAPGTDYLLSRYRTLCDAVRAIDPTRPAMAAAEAGPVGSQAAGNHLMTRGITDFIGVNYSEQWYDEMLAIDPDILILGTENYVYFRSTKEDRNARWEMNCWFDVEADDRVMGNFLWTGIDYLGESWEHWPNTGSFAGLVDVTGFAKPVADFYRTFWREKEPQVYIDIYRQPVAEISEKLGQWGSPKQDRIWEADTQRVELSTYTNCEEVELFLNGESLGIQRLADAPNRILRWEVAYAPGELLAVGRNNGEEAARCALHTPGAPAALRLTPTTASLAANGWDVALVEAVLVDAQGNECHFDGEAVFSVEGAGTLAAVGNGGLKFHGPFQEGTVPAFHDRCTAYVRAGEEAGRVVLTASMGGLNASCEIQIG